MPLRPARCRLVKRCVEALGDGIDVELVGVVVDRIGLGLAHHRAVDDIFGPGEAELTDFELGAGDQVGIGHVPGVVTGIAEIFHAVAGGVRIGHHVGRPGLEVLDAADLDAGIVDIDPVVVEALLAAGDQPDDQEVAVAQAGSGCGDGSGLSAPSILTSSLMAAVETT